MGGFWANGWNITKILFIYLFIPFFQELTYRSDPSTDFYGWWLKRRELEQGCAFWGFVVIAVYFGVKSPENLIFGGRESAFSSQTGNMLKVACYRNYYIDFNQILHNDRDHKVVVVGGPNRRPRNPRWRTAAILKKNRWIAISLQSFDRFWWDLVQWRILPPYSGRAVRISNFWTSKMAAAAIFKKITKNAISPQRFDRSLRNLVGWCKMGLLTVPTVKKVEFHKSKMAHGRHFENR